MRKMTSERKKPYSRKIHVNQTFERKMKIREQTEGTNICSASLRLNENVKPGLQRKYLSTSVGLRNIDYNLQRHGVKLVTREKTVGSAKVSNFRIKKVNRSKKRAKRKKVIVSKVPMQRRTEVSLGEIKEEETLLQ